jgi:hypothetical protein
LTILYPSSAKVNTARRPFGLGLVQPEPSRPEPRRTASPRRPVEPRRPAHTPEDERWWAAESDRLERERGGRELESRYAESYATDLLTLGLIPRDFAAGIMARSLIGHDA